MLKFVSFFVSNSFVYLIVEWFLILDFIVIEHERGKANFLKIVFQLFACGFSLNYCASKVLP